MPPTLYSARALVDLAEQLDQLSRGVGREPHARRGDQPDWLIPRRGLEFGLSSEIAIGTPPCSGASGPATTSPWTTLLPSAVPHVAVLGRQGAPGH
jgi:hypothetical protein